MPKLERKMMNSAWPEKNMIGNLSYKKKEFFSEGVNRMIEKSMKSRGKVPLKKKLFKGN